MKYNENNKPLVCMMTQSTCYKGTKTFTPKGVLWHSTGANNPNLKRYVQPDDNAEDRAEWLNRLGKNQYNNDWNHIDRQAGLNFWIGKLADGNVAAVQTMPWNYRPWGCGSGSKGSLNDTHIQFEICEDGLTDASYFNAVYKEACEMTAYLCKMFGIDPKGSFTYKGVTVPTIIDHAGSHSLGMGSNHGDVQHWFKRYGKTLDNVRDDVAKLLTEETPAQPTVETAPAVDTAPVTPAPAVTDTEKAIWDFLYGKLGNAYGAAGLMGNLYAESALRPTNLQNTYEKKLGLSDAEYTAAVDNGSYTNFVKDSSGYGLAQWTYWSRKQALLTYAKEKGASIGDLQTQLDFLWKEIQGYTSVLNTLKTAATVRAASDAVLTGYERPADQGEAVQVKRAGYGQGYYDKYAVSAPVTPDTPTIPTTQTTPSNQTEDGNTRCPASKVIAVAVSQIGYKEKASNASLDNPSANAGSANYTKYARDFDQNYPKWYNGKKNGYAWCDMFVDWCFLTAYGYENALRLLCQPERSAGAGCTYSLRYYKNKGQFHTGTPKVGDQIFFGTSLDNSTHTGIVEKVEGGKVYTIEGNTSDQVARRSYALSNSRILGYGRPAYDAENGATITAPATPATQPETGTAVPFLVRISIPDLNIRKGPGTNYARIGQYTGKGVFTIVEVASGTGSASGWGRLKSGLGWVSLDYCVRI